MTVASRYWAPGAWVDGRWQASVVLETGADGHWSRIAAGEPAPHDAEVLAGPVLPGLVDAHSHAFQRAFAGLAERREGAGDDFWSWRDRMYRAAATPRSASSTTCSTAPTARLTTTRWRCRWRLPTPRATPASA
jgi:cytosine/adenosine deaminase-related metal-dependent hydrolase